RIRLRDSHLVFCVRPRHWMAASQEDLHQRRLSHVRPLLPVWITSLAFLAANLGAQELVGMSGNGAKYGIITAHFYWVGAVPAMIFVGLFMMPFYWGSRARSVPEYLKMRFDEKTRALNALSFAGMTVFSSGISMYALGLLLRLILGWSVTTSVLCSAASVLAYSFLGAL